ncbi:glycosyltransferase family 4 protein [Angustibacter sp. McL0619]|uniref:glycosyltransferase family 4 protein n=1 Tax=Angustibacter sp. McL0619 TaxID=3415676 RepID=UPI003CEB4748
MSTSTSRSAASLGGRARQATVALLRRAAEHAPVAGPNAMRRAVEQARLQAAGRAGRAGDAAGARRAAAPLMTSTDPLVRARALDAIGDRAAALDAVREVNGAGGSAAAGDERSVAAALLHLKLLPGSAAASERASVLSDLVTRAPADNDQAKAVVSALRDHGDAVLARAYRPQLAASGFRKPLATLDDQLDTWQLMARHADGPEAFAAAVAALPDRRRPRLTARALGGLARWDELSQCLADCPPAALAASGLTAAELARWGARALRAGHTRAAVSIAEQALSRNARHRGALAVVENGQDQLQVVAQRWQPPPVAAPSYEPRPDAVLSVLSQSLPIRSGGYATRTHGVLSSLVARGWDVEAVTRLGFPYDRWPGADPRTVPESDVVDGIRYHRLLQDGVRAYPQFPLARYVGTFADGVETVARRHRARLVHASSFYVTGLAAASAARRLGLPFVYEMRGLEDLMKNVRDPDFASTDRYQFLDHVETEVCHEADAVFVITEALRVEMAARGVAEDKLVVLPNGVHTDQFAPRERDRDLERELGVEGIPVIGYAGSLVDYEGLELLMAAVAVLREQEVAFRVLVVGDGPQEASVRAAADELGLADRVTFTGRVPHDQVSRYLSLVDVTPFPRLPLPVCELISPMKPFEALAMGKAVVVSSVAALTEIIEDGVTGLVFEKGNAQDLARILRLLLESPQLRAQLGEAGLAWVRRERDWSAVTAIADETYRAVLAAHDARPLGPA